MPRFIDLTGQRFGRLVAIEKVKTIGGRAFWKCECDCGNEKVVSSNHLKMGTVQSCGCLIKELRKNTKNTTHGKSNTRLYGIWNTMRNRCYNTKTDAYENYGGRGITVCDEWKNSFQIFYEWAMANGYADNLTIDRINVNGNYEPSNCRWATRKEQNYNTRLRRDNKSGHKGVRFDKRVNRWVAYIRIENCLKHIGCFKSYEEAVEAREKAEMEYYGTHTQ